MSIQSGDVVKVNVQSVIDAIAESYDVEDEISGIIVSVDEHDSDPDKDFFEIKIKMPTLYFYNSEFRIGDRRAKA